MYTAYIISERFERSWSRQMYRNSCATPTHGAFGSRAWHVSRHGLQLRLRLLLLRLRLPVNEANRTYGSDILW
jgi:hypothetical protein